MATRSNQRKFSLHPDYESAVDTWELVRDCLKGSKAVKCRGARYLPKLHEQETGDYNNYKRRAVFFNAVKRTRDAATGLLLRKTPELIIEDALKPLQGDIDLAGGTLLDYTRTVVGEMASVGRGGTVIDWSDSEDRPYFAFYQAEDILSWDCRRIQGKMILSYLLLRECSYELNDRYEYTSIVSYREYRNPEGNAVEYLVTRMVDGATSPHEDRMPVELKRKGKTLHTIPFVFHTICGDCPSVTDSPLSDLAEINISHYMTSADLENGRHVAGIPTPYAAGFDSDTELVLGTNHAWVTDQVDAKAGFIEYTGNGLGALERAMAEKQEQMAALGARILEAHRDGGKAEAYETVQLRSNSEQANLVNLADAVSATMSKALQWAAWWVGNKWHPGDYGEANTIILATDFVASKLDAPSLTALVGAYQAGVISWPTFYYNLEQGEFYKDGWTEEEEDSAIATKPPEQPNAAAQAAKAS